MHLYLVVDWVLSCCLTSETHSLADLIAAIIQRVGDDIDPRKLPQILVYFKIIIFHFHLVGFFIAPTSNLMLIVSHIL